MCHSEGQNQNKLKDPQATKYSFKILCVFMFVLMIAHTSSAHLATTVPSKKDTEICDELFKLTMCNYNLATICNAAVNMFSVSQTNISNLNHWRSHVSITTAETSLCQREIMGKYAI
jgi:hypothetical protein